MTLRLITGDCRVEMGKLAEASVDSVVTDPPYHLTTGKKGGTGEASVNLDSPYGRARIGTGFMGMKWDGGDVAFDPATWVEAFRVLKPGGMVVAFGGTRTYHRLVCAIEDAGFEVRDMLAWLYGSGFPKSTDKAKIPETWRGWNTALKPAIEPICLARKPMIGTLAENLEAFGTGALWIDGCRIDPDGVFDADGRAMPVDQLGRWPANVMHDGSDEVLSVFPPAPGQLATSSSSSSRKNQNTYGAMARGSGGIAPRADNGSAARFFYCAKADRNDRNDGLQMKGEKPLLWSSGAQNPGSFQSANTKRAAQNYHPTVKPTDLMRWICRLVTPPLGTVLDPFMGSGSTLKAAELESLSGIGIERDPDYIEIARCRVASGAPLFAEVAA